MTSVGLAPGSEVGFPPQRTLRLKLWTTTTRSRDLPVAARPISVPSRMA